ncbi:26S proteasome non-ATPase regulatory subunit 9 [Tirmania nivea]|nr:26S proteasome non-ATPase regulatory subunit 9 [Tirmania nivea]
MDIHFPTVDNPSNSNGLNNNAVPTTKEELLELINKKDIVEGELRTLGAVLDSHKVNMNTSLTTFDGYPRDDIDVAQIRTTRARIIHLRNDHKALLSQIEKGLHALHSSLPPAPAPETLPQARPPSPLAAPDIPFAEIDMVALGSPAATAGLRLGDKVKRFGACHALNHDGLKKVAEVVGNNEGRGLKVVVERGAEEVEVTVTPARGWGGRGLLGCHLKPL